MSRRPPQRRTPAIRSDLGPVMDTGLSVRARRPVKQRSPYPTMTVAVAVVGLAAIGWSLAWEGGKPATQSEQAHTIQAIAAEEKESAPEREPTPLLAREGGTDIRLAIDPSQVTAVAFHQASGEYALHMTSLVPDADMALAAQLKAVPPLDPTAPVAEGVWPGLVLRLWRSGRGGMPDSAADMGADPGTPVYSPITGTVIAVKPYLLYDKWEDYEIHIRPQGRPEVEAVLIHVQEVRAEVGDRVKAGVTQLGAVRKMSDKIAIQLAGYTTNGGDHVHFQINEYPPAAEVPAPGES
ncbi:MAG: M23 family metallopeptidase [Actinobacteria bacterium]|nr:M23 family metallopeptidase [Actinomycetota bacterium]